MECLHIMKASCVYFVPWDSIASDVDSIRGNPHRTKFYFKLAPIFAPTFALCSLLLAICYASAILLFYHCCDLHIGAWGKEHFGLSRAVKDKQPGTLVPV